MIKPLIFKFLIFNILLLFLLLYIAFIIRNYRKKIQNKKPVSLMQFINQGKLDFNVLFIGFIFGFIFGFMDNIVIWFFLEKLNKYLPGDFKMKAVLGNTYSDFIGSIAGTFMTLILYDFYNINYDTKDQPIWMNTLSLLCGNFAGIFFSKIISSK